MQKDMQWVDVCCLQAPLEECNKQLEDRLLAVFMVIAESEIPIDCVVREAQGCDRNQSVGQKNDNPFKYIFRLCTFM